MSYLFSNDNIYLIGQTESTNDYAAALAQKTDKNLFAVMAKEQTKGKGQAGNVWFSEKESSITLSICLKPEFIEPQQQFELNKITALSVRDFLCQAGCLAENVHIKWPNDVLIHKKKTAGILTENIIAGHRYKQAVIGVGININQTSFPNDLPNATSLAIETGKQFDTENLGVAFLKIFEKWLSVLIDNDLEKIHTAYLDALYLFGVPAKFKFNNKEAATATIKGVDHYGRLLLHTRDNQTVLCQMKEVAYL